MPPQSVRAEGLTCAAGDPHAVVAIIPIGGEIEYALLLAFGIFLRRPEAQGTIFLGCHVLERGHHMRTAYTPVHGPLARTPCPDRTVFAKLHRDDMIRQRIRCTLNSQRVPVYAPRLQAATLCLQLFEILGPYHGFLTHLCSSSFVLL